MKSATPELQALFSSTRRIARCDLYSFSLAGGGVLRYTNGDTDIVVGGNVYLGAAAPMLKRSRIRARRGIEIDDLDVTVYADDRHTINGVPWKEAIINGALDGAWLNLEYAYAADPGSAIVGTLNAFFGRVADTQASTTGGELKVRSALELLDTKMPRNLYQPGCLNQLFDTGCAKSRVAYEDTGSVAANSNQSVLFCNLTDPDDYHALGEVLFTSGANAGVRRTVREYLTGKLSLSYPLPNDVTVGDTFLVWPGCDGQRTTCDIKFANKPRYRGYPFVPMPEVAI